MRKLKYLGLTPIVFASLIFLTTGCYKDSFEFDDLKEDFITWEPDLAIPLVNSTLTAQDIISVADSTNVYDIGSDNFITLIYRARIFSQTINEFLQIPIDPQLITEISLDNNELNEFANNNAVTTVESPNLLVGITSPGLAQLNEVEFRSGTMNISFTSDFQHSGTLTVSMPELKLNGAAFNETYPINYQSGTVTFNVNVPLAGYRMDLNNSGQQNELDILYTLNLNNTGGSQPSTANSVSVQQSLNNLVLEYADGDFGSFVLDVDPGTVDLDLIQNLTNGSIYFEDPKLTLLVTNGIGSDVRLTVPQLQASGNDGSVAIDIQDQLPGSPPSTIIAGATSSTTPSVSEFTFSKSNSNIGLILNGSYTQLDYEVGAQLNPNGSPSNNFATFNSAIEIQADVELPFFGNVDNYTIVDTIDAPFDDASDLADVVERGLLRISTESRFPVDGKLKLYFADENYNLLDSALTGDDDFIIRSGQTAPTPEPNDGDALYVVGPTVTNNDIELDSSGVSSLFKSKYLFLEASLTSSNSAMSNIKLYTDNNIKVEIGLRAKFSGGPSTIQGL